MTVKELIQLKTDINIDLADNTIGNITPSILRNDILDCIDSIEEATKLKIAQVSNSDETTNINLTSYTDIPINGNTVLLDTSNFTILGSGIQCLKSGRVKVSASVHLTSGGQRATLKIRLAKNGVVFGPIGCSAYIRNITGHNEASNHITTWVNVSANDVITLRGIREGNSSSSIRMINGASVLILEQY